MSKLPAPIALGLLASLLSGCPDPAPAVETEGSSSGDTTSGPPATTLPPTTLDSSGTTVGIDTSTTSGDTSTSTGNDSSSSGSSSGDSTTGGIVCEEPFEPNEDIGSAVGAAVATGTNLGAGDHLEDLCGLRTFGGSDTDFSDTDFSETGIFPGTTDFSGTGIFTTGFSDTGIFPGTTGFSETGIFPGTTGFSDTGVFDSGEPPTYEEYLVRWTAPGAGTYTFDLNGSDYDTLLGITDACGTSELGCNDDCFDLQSGLSLDLAADDTIMIIIGGFAGNVGNFVLNIEEGAPLDCKF